MHPRRIKALIFDFDGLILDTETASFRVWSETYAKYGCDFPLDLWAGRYDEENPRFDAYKYLEGLLGRSLDNENVVEQRWQQFLEIVEKLPIMPGVEEYLTNAKRLGLKLGVASASPFDWVDEHLSRVGLYEYFDCIRAAEHAKIAKPSPDIYQVTLTALDVLPSEAIALEDSPHGILAATRAGIFCVAVPNFVMSQLPTPNADLVLKSLAEMPLEQLLEVVEDMAEV